ncbi:MAG: O-antigen ligase family protein [Elusimicrobiales bacterium]|nr:O-antigen ligase family protein [Elusimicrobiales bacterium]
MTRPAWLERSPAYAPAFLLVLAAAAGGLRTPGTWLLFGALYLAWTALRPGGLAASGQEAALLFFGWLGAAAVFSPEPGVSLGTLGGYGVCALVFFSAAGGEGGETGWLRALYGLAAAAAVVLLYEKFSSGLVHGLIGQNPNYSAVFCAAAFAPAALALAGAGENKDRLLYGGLAALLAAGLAASGSRGALLAGFAAAACGFGLTRRWRWLGGLLLLAALAAALLPAAVLGAALKLEDPRAFARPQLWGSALDAAAASPLLGWGPGRFAAAFELFKFPYFDGVSYYGHGTLHAHSEFLNLAAEAGFPAALLLLLAVYQAARAGWRERLPFLLAALAALLQGAVDMVFYSGAVSLLFWGSLGFAAAGAPAAGGRKLKVWLAAAALLCLLAPYAGRLARSPYSGELALAESRRSPVVKLALARSAQAAAPTNALPVAEEGYARAAAGDLAGAADAFGRALSLEPRFDGALVALAGTYALAGDYASACAVLAGGPLNLEAPQARSPYNRALMDFDRQAAGKLEKECVKKKPGAATAASPKPRSKATK